MKQHLGKILFLTAALALTGCSTGHATPYGQGFWAQHGFFTLLGWLLFPRIMFWIFSAMTGGFGFWLGVFLVPRIMVAFWATTYYWHTNPVLCLFAWLFALAGETAEKSSASKAGGKSS